MANTLENLFYGCVLWAGITGATFGQTTFPSDPQKTNCSVDQATFNSWFGGNAPTIDAPATFANSVGFPTNNTKCDFYKWSAQMFLWLSSPSGQNYVFDSVNFFDVSPEDASGNRVLLPNLPGTEGGTFSVRSTKMDEVIGETGQAGGGGTLISQNGSIVYYGIHVNDVYGYFLSLVKNSKMPLPDFPNTPAGLASVVAYARSQGVMLPDANALTMELKTSWVDASSVANAGDYLTITATVPKYNKSNNRYWPVGGTETKRLAMVGMHVVGTVQDHPEMVWATVEHLNNAPDTSYYYINKQGQRTLVRRPTSGSWTFASKTTASIQWNQERARVYSKPSASLPVCKTEPCKPGDIVAYMDATISPSLTVRMNPWGSASANASGAQIQDPENNSELISLNNDVMTMLPAGDVRRNYFVSGAVWTQHGNLPTYDGKGPAFKQIGSLSLANSTMETYHQEVSTSATATNAGCFMCHSISGAQAIARQGVELSHIFDAIQPIPRK